jgi:hypothetical protein
MSDQTQTNDQAVTDAQKQAADEAKAQAKAAADQAKAEAKAAKEKAAAEAKAAKQAAAAQAKEAKEKAKAEAAEAKKKAAEEKAAAKAEEARKKAEEKAAAQAKTKEVMPSQNGITRPRPDGSCGKVWALADRLTAERGSPVPISVLAPEAAKEGLNDATTRTQYARWKQFNGIWGAVPKDPAPAPAPATEASNEAGQAAA